MLLTYVIDTRLKNLFMLVAQAFTVLIVRQSFLKMILQNVLLVPMLLQRNQMN